MILNNVLLLYQDGHCAADRPAMERPREPTCGSAE